MKYKLNFTVPMPYDILLFYDLCVYFWTYFKIWLEVSFAMKHRYDKVRLG